MSRVRSTLVLASACCVVTALSVACGVTKAGSPVPAGNTAPSSSASVGGGVSNGAPAVPHPVEVSRFKQQPCSVLTAEQVKTLGIKSQAHPDLSNPSIPECDWPETDYQPDVGVNWLPNQRGLSDLYGIAKTGGFTVFSPLAPINGFPAVHSQGGSASRTDCVYAVGFNDKDVAQVQIHDDQHGDACNAALQVAKDVTLTVKGVG